MTVPELETYTTDQLIDELINRQTFAGVVIWYTSSVKQGQLENTQVKMTKSPPLSQQGAESLLRDGLGMLPGMFGQAE